MKRGATLLSLLVLGAGPVLAQATFHGDVARTGVYPGAGPRTLGGVKWTFKTGGPVVGSPVVADGVVYIASLDTQLYALDAATGQQKWKFKSRLPIASTPAITGDTVFLVTSTGVLAALNRADGTPKWVFVAEFERRFEAKNLHGLPSAAQTIPDGYDVFLSSPAVARGKVYFGTGDGGVYAVDEKTGTLQWKFSTGDVVHTSPAVVDGTVYVGSWDSALYALDADTGAKKWAFQAGRDPSIHNQEGFQGSPAVVDGTVYVGCRDAHVYALDAATGRRKWDYPTSKSWVVGTPAVKDGVVYVGTSDSARFMALDAKTGRLKWDFNAHGYIFSSAALAGDLAYVGDHNGRLYAVDTKSGALVWEFVTDAAKADPSKFLNPDGSFVQEVLYAPFFGDFQDMYLAFFKFASVGAIVSSPAVADGVVFVGSTDGNVYALR
jgi:outer membrane protein assembly factor BamB